MGNGAAGQCDASVTNEVAAAELIAEAIHHEVIMAGFGGQGVLTMGQMLAEAAMREGRQVIWTPAYGPEMRGGPAFCTVIVSATPIGAPVVSRVDTAVIMDNPSLAKYQGQVRERGALLLNSSLVHVANVRPDRRAFPIAANHLAEEIGNMQIVNMVMLGAFLRLTNLVRADSILQALRDALPARRQHLIPLNEQALTRGAQALEALL